MKLRAWGANLQELFVHGAQGMMEYLFGGSVAATHPVRTETIVVEAPDREALLVDWLSELLYRATSGYCAYVAFRVQELSDFRLTAMTDAVAATAVEDIKAVTHHELSIREQDGRLEATVVFDI